MGIFGPPNVKELESKKDIEGLLKALKHKKISVQRDAAIALGKMGDERALEPLIQILKEEAIFEPGPGLNEVKLALAKIGEKSISPLIEVTRFGNIYAQSAAKDILVEIGKPAVRSLIMSMKVGPGGAATSAVNVLGRLRDARAVEPLIEALKDGINPVKGGAARALGMIGDPRAVEPLIGALRTGADTVREDAAFALGEIGDPKAVEPLCYVLENALMGQMTKLPDAAAKALAKIGEPAVGPLIRILGKGREVGKRKAAWALGEIGNAKAVKPLIQVLKNDKDSSFRGSVALALGKLGDTKAVDPLIQALKNDDLGVKQKAAIALGKIGDSRAVEPLTQTIQDTNVKFLKEAAEEALQNIRFKKIKK